MNRITPGLSQRGGCLGSPHPLLSLFCPTILKELEAHLSPSTGNWRLQPAKENQVLNSVWCTEQTGINFSMAGLSGPRLGYSALRVSKPEWARWAIGIREDNSTALFLCCVRAKLLHSCPTLCDTVVCSPPSTSVHGILQARIWSGLPCPPAGESSRPRDWTSGSYVSCTGSLPLVPPGKPFVYMDILSHPAQISIFEYAP